VSLPPSGLFSFTVVRRPDLPGGTTLIVSTLADGEVFRLDLDAEMSLELTLMYVNAVAVTTPMREIGDQV
jgi:hypothetical protein